MDDAVEDGVGEGGLADHLVPTADGQLAGDQSGGGAMAVLDDLQHVAALIGIEPLRSPIVENQQSSAKSLGTRDRPTGQVCAAQVEARPHSAKWSWDRVSHRPISPLKSGARPIVPVQGQIRGPLPIVLPLLAIGRSHLGIPDKTL